MRQGVIPWDVSKQKPFLVVLSTTPRAFHKSWWQRMMIWHCTLHILQFPDCWGLSLFTPLEIGIVEKALISCVRLEWCRAKKKMIGCRKCIDHVAKTILPCTNHVSIMVFVALLCALFYYFLFNLAQWRKLHISCKFAKKSKIQVF